jgi:hypothetical protein
MKSFLLGLFSVLGIFSVFTGPEMFKVERSQVRMAIDSPSRRGPGDPSHAAFTIRSTDRTEFSSRKTGRARTGPR